MGSLRKLIEMQKLATRSSLPSLDSFIDMLGPYLSFISGGQNPADISEREMGIILNDEWGNLQQNPALLEDWNNIYNIHAPGIEQPTFADSLLSIEDDLVFSDWLRMSEEGRKDLISALEYPDEALMPGEPIINISTDDEPDSGDKSIEKGGSLNRYLNKIARQMSFF